MTEPHRDIMAPDTEPTDEELAIVMRAARDAALARRAKSDEWMRQRLAEAVRKAHERSAASSKP